jgi:hypothetical protein
MSNPIDAVFDAIGSVVSAVIDNALPIIETIAFDYFLPPGVGEAIGAALDVSSAVGTTIAQGVGHAAISAINGGSLASIAAAGLTPIIASPEIQKSVFGGSLTGPGGVINGAVSKVISDPVLGNIVSGAIAKGTTAGIIAGVTGGDIMQAATNAGLGSVASAAVGNLWTSTQKLVPATDTLTKTYNDLYSQVKDALPTFNKISDAQNNLQDTAQTINTLKNTYDTNLEQYNHYKDLFDQGIDKHENAALANQFGGIASDAATQINNTYYPLYETQLSSLQDLTSANKDLLTQYSPILNQMGTLQNQYTELTNQTMGDYYNYKMTEAVQNGDYVDAANYYQRINELNASWKEINPNGSVVTNLTPQETKLLNSIYNARDNQTLQSLVSQANLDAGFNKTHEGVNPNAPAVNQSGVITPTAMGAAVTNQGTTTNPYDLLPKYPGTDTTTTPTTPTTDTGTTNTGTTTDTSTTNTNTTTSVDTSTSPVGNLTQNAQGNFVDTLGRVFTRQVINGVANYVLSSAINGGTPTPPTPTPPKPTPPKPTVPTIVSPPKHVDISTLKPFTGTLPTGLATTTPKPSTTPTGGLATTTTPATTTAANPVAPATSALNAVTNPASTPIQTVNSGLQSVSQPQVQANKSPAQHVDISTLTPVTNNAQLANLGLNIG